MRFDIWIRRVRRGKRTRAPSGCSMTDLSAVLFTLRNALAGYGVSPGWVIVLRPYRCSAAAATEFPSNQSVLYTVALLEGMWKVAPKRRPTGSRRQYGPDTRPPCSNMILI